MAGLEKLLDWFCNVLAGIVIILAIAGVAWTMVAPILKLLHVTNIEWFSLIHLSVFGIVVEDMATITIIFMIGAFISEMRNIKKTNQD